ncbi:hypothetical protein PanWU01x14_359330, partial [Parasponia andersonii]
FEYQTDLSPTSNIEVVDFSSFAISFTTTFVVLASCLSFPSVISTLCKAVPKGIFVGIWFYLDIFGLLQYFSNIQLSLSSFWISNRPLSKSFVTTPVVLTSCSPFPSVISTLCKAVPKDILVEVDFSF